MSEGFVLSNKAIDEIARIIQKVDTIRGSGVTNTPDSIIINSLPPTKATNFNPPISGMSFKARITAVSGSFPIFTYTCQRVVSVNPALTTAAGWVTDGVNLTPAYNAGSEFSGTPPYIYGNGVLITSSSGQVNSTDCVIQSIGVGAVVDLCLTTDGSGNTYYLFSAMNSAT